MIVPTADIVDAAYHAGGVALACNLITLEYAEAIVAGAARVGAPVILQISHNCVDYHGGLGGLGTAALAVARAAAGPVAVHLDHARSVALVDEAMDLGIASVMFDASELEDEANVRTTRAVVARCHARGVWVEGELGAVGGKDGIHSATARTDPAAAAAYVAATGVDALAVAVGSSHARPARDAQLDLALVSRLHAAVDVPLVLHGSSGVPDTGLVAAVAAGLTKINIATQLSARFTDGVRAALDADPAVVDARRYLRRGRDELTAEVARLLTLLGAGATGASR